MNRITSQPYAPPSFQQFGISPPQHMFESTAFHPTEINTLVQTIESSASFHLQMASTTVIVFLLSLSFRDLGLWQTSIGIFQRR